MLHNTPIPKVLKLYGKQSQEAYELTNYPLKNTGLDNWQKEVDSHEKWYRE